MFIARTDSCKLKLKYKVQKSDNCLNTNETLRNMVFGQC